MFKALALLLVTAIAAVAAQPGGYNDAPVTTEDIDMLRLALSSDQYDAHNRTNSICLNSVDTLQKQVVDGTNYKFSVNGCELVDGAYMDVCPIDCKASQFQVIVFYQNWSNTLAVLSLTSTTPPSPTPSAPGGYKDVPVTNEDIDLLTLALSSEQYDDHDRTYSICLNRVDSLQMQVVDGTNYKFVVNGCDLVLGAYMDVCPVDCQAGQYQVVVFYQSWSNTVAVKSISPLSNPTTKPPTPTTTKPPTPTPAPSTPQPTPAKSKC